MLGRCARRREHGPGDDAMTTFRDGKKEGGGGFASLRRRDEPMSLPACNAIELRVCGDGKRYKLS
jgi:hypothetical protein